MPIAASTQTADVVAKARAVLSEPELLRAMFVLATSRRTHRRELVNFDQTPPFYRHTVQCRQFSKIRNLI